MKIVGCDLHAGQQSIAMMDSETGELSEKLLKHEGNAVREFYSSDLAVKLARAGKANGSLAILCSLLKVVPDPRPISAEMKQLRFTHEALSTIQLRQKQRKT